MPTIAIGPRVGRSGAARARARRPRGVDAATAASPGRGAARQRRSPSGSWKRSTIVRSRRPGSSSRAAAGAPAASSERVPAEVEEVVVDPDRLERAAPRARPRRSCASSSLRGATSGSARPPRRLRARGSARRSTFPFGVSGSASSATNADGHHVLRQLSPQVLPQLRDLGSLARPAHATYATSRLSPARPPAPRPPRRFTAGCCPEHRLDLPQLDPVAPHLHLWSIRPRNSMPPVRQPPHQVPRPVQPPPGSAPNGSGTNRSAVSSGRPRYPRASPSPPMYSSPATPTGTGPIPSSSTYTARVRDRPPDRHRRRLPGPRARSCTCERRRSPSARTRSAADPSPASARSTSLTHAGPTAPRPRTAAAAAREDASAASSTTALNSAVVRNSVVTPCSPQRLPQLPRRQRHLPASSPTSRAPVQQRPPDLQRRRVERTGVRRLRNPVRRPDSCT